MKFASVQCVLRTLYIVKYGSAHYSTVNRRFWMSSGTASNHVNGAQCATLYDECLWVMDVKTKHHCMCACGLHNSQVRYTNSVNAWRCYSMRILVCWMALNQNCSVAQCSECACKRQHRTSLAVAHYFIWCVVRIYQTGWPDEATAVFTRYATYTLFNKNQAASNFLSPETEVTCRTAAITIRVVLLSPYFCIPGISLFSIHYSQSRRVYTY
jgi:hypothetical protein